MADQDRFTRWVTGGAVMLAGALVLAACSTTPSHPQAAAHHTTATSTSPKPSGSGSTTTVPAAMPTPTTTPVASAAPKVAPSAPATTLAPRTSPATTPPASATTTTATTATTVPPDSIPIEAAHTTHGTVLINSLGFTLYMLTADRPTSVCTTIPCTVVWPPVKATGGGVAGPGIQQSLLGQQRLPDGTEQVTYGGHPLYTYVGDRKPGDTTGEGIVSFGGIWWVLSAATGAPIS